MNDQLALEQRMQERGERRARKAIEKALSRGEAAETPAGVQLARRAVAPLSDAIRAFLKDAYSGKAGRRHTAAPLLRDVDPELAAYITVRCTLGCAVIRRPLKGAAMVLTERLELELIADAFETESEALYRAIVRNAAARGIAPIRQAKAVHLANKKFGVLKRKPWTITQRHLLGTKLIELFVETMGLVKITRVYERKRTVYRLELTDEIEEWFKKYNDAAALTRPMFLPTIIPPKPWEDIRGGAYYSPILRGGAIVSRSFPGQLNALKEASMPAVYAGLNGLQNTRWAINKDVLRFMRDAWEAGVEGLPLPSRYDDPIPEVPPEVHADERGGPLRKSWRNMVRLIHNRNVSARSARFELDRALSIAEENKDRDAIYFPHRLDFRGRAYSSATSLNPQGPDEVRALLQFADGKPLGDRGQFWLGVHGANLFGFDKVSLEERFEWSKANMDAVLECAGRPLQHRWWTEADKPWSFLAWCMEWADMYFHGFSGQPIETFVSHLPVALDGSCNGIQHYSAMLRDPVGGEAVNLTVSAEPQDIYERVAELVRERLAERAGTNDDPKYWMAQAWLDFGIDRTITKRPVMVLPYGGTFHSCRDYVRAAVREKIKDGAPNPFGEGDTLGDAQREAEHFLAREVWAAIGSVVTSARTAMDWLQQVARVAAKHNVPLRWTTPTGFVVVQDYREKRSRRIETRFCGKLLIYRTKEDGHRIDRARQCSAVAPNFVHSLDASALMLTVQACLAQGVNTFAMIHDSYATHAADTDKMASVLRSCFVSLYEQHDVLREFRDQIAIRLTPEQVAELPPLPEKGTLDLKEVLNSPYFFA